MCVDLIDDKGTITMIVPTSLVQHHEQKLVSSNDISITNFTILPKTISDCGDCDRIISIDDSSIIETISPICNEYNFILTQQSNHYLRAQISTQLE